MAKLGLGKLGLKLPKDIVEAKYNDAVSIEVRQFIPTFDKIHLVASAVKSSIVDGHVNEMVLEVALHYLIVVNYTNISFTEKQISNMIDTYDLLDSNGVIDLVIANLPEGEYDYLFKEALKSAERYNELTRSSMEGFAGQLETNNFLQEVLAKQAPGIVANEDADLN